MFDGLGGFDSRWKDAAYDVDLCWRLVLCGFVLGYAPNAEVHHLRRHSLRGLGRQMASYSFYNHSLLANETRTLRTAGFRGLDLFSMVSSLKGGVHARLLGAKPDPRFHPTRRGELPAKLAALLPPGYAHLHHEGWSYWKDSPSVSDDGGDLILFRARRGERFRLNSSAWKIWHVKSNGKASRSPSHGQSEHAALALGQRTDDAEVLRDIDQCTLDLRTRRLLP